MKYDTLSYSASRYLSIEDPMCQKLYACAITRDTV